MNSVGCILMVGALVVGGWIGFGLAIASVWAFYKGGAMA